MYENDIVEDFFLSRYLPLTFKQFRGKKVAEEKGKSMYMRIHAQE